MNLSLQGVQQFCFKPLVTSVLAFTLAQPAFEDNQMELLLQVRAHTWESSPIKCFTRHPASMFTSCWFIPVLLPCPLLHLTLLAPVR